MYLTNIERGAIIQIGTQKVELLTHDNKNVKLKLDGQEHTLGRSDTLATDTGFLRAYYYNPKQATFAIQATENIKIENL